LTQNTTSKDIETVGSVLRVTYPSVLDLQWDELVRSVPKPITQVSLNYGRKPVSANISYEWRMADYEIVERLRVLLRPRH
jgi:hypothetical protein